MDSTMKYQYLTPKMKPNECIRLYQNASQKEITSTCKNKDQGRSQPVRITQLINPKTTTFATRKKTLPIRMPTPFSIKKRDGSIQNNDVGNKLQQRKSMMMHLPSNITETKPHSICNEELAISSSNIYSQKIQRKTYFNVVPTEKIIKENISLMCPNMQEGKKLTYSNSSGSRNSKSLVLPPNSIKTMYLKKHSMLPSAISKQNDKAIKSLGKLQMSKNVHIQDYNAQKETLENTRCKSQTNINLHETKHTTSLTDKEQEHKYQNSYQSNSFIDTNAGNLKDICHELKNIILIEKSKLPMDKNTVNISKEDHICIDKNTIISLKYYLEDLLDVFHNNASKVDSLLTHVKKILHTSSNSMEGHVHSIDSNNDVIKNTLQTYQDQKVDKNNMNISINKLEEDNVKRKASVELNTEEKENKIPSKIII